MKKNISISISLYRTLIILQLVFPLIGASIEMFRPDPKLKLLDEILLIQPQGWEIAVLCVTSIIIFIIIIGLLLRKEWARKAYLYTLIPSYLIYLLPFMYWSYMSGISAIFNNLSFVCSGMLLLILILPQLYQPLFNKDIPIK